MAEETLPPSPPEAPPPPPPPSGDGQRAQVAIEDEMRKSYLDYSMSVIIGRALPDVRDGLKPVHRRILYAMHDRGAAPQPARTRKCAGVVGEVLKKYHPHGDASVYDALVRLAQHVEPPLPAHRRPGQLRLASTATRAAAYRYTECAHRPARRRPPRRHRQGDGRLRAELRRLHRRAARPPHPLPEPPRQRLAPASRSAWRRTSRPTTWAR